MNEIPDNLNIADSNKVDEWFLSALSAAELPMDALLGVVTATAGAGSPRRADSLADLLQEKLNEQHDGPGTARLLRTRYEWSGEKPDFRDICKTALARALEKRPAIAGTVPLNSNTPIRECLRRLDLLMSFQPGVFVWDRTWKFGVITAVDEFYKKVTIDFDTKPAHQMTFGYATETLKVVDAGHIYAQRRQDPAGFAALAQQDPAEIVRMMIRSFGPLTTPELKIRLVEDKVVTEAGHKAFWDAARKVLKKDLMVEVPSLRNEPIRILDKPLDHADQLSLALQSERDPKVILDLITSLEQKIGGAALSEAMKTLVNERLAYVVRAGEGSRYDMVAMALVAARRLGLECTDGFAAKILDPRALAAAINGMPARELGRLFKILGEVDADKAVSLLMTLLPTLLFSQIDAIVEYMSATGRERACSLRFLELLLAPNVEPEIIYWMCKRIQRATAWAIIRPYDMVTQVINSLEFLPNERVRIRNAITGLFESPGWMESVLKMLAPADRASLLTRINNSNAWNEVTRRAILAEMITLYPELKDVVVATDEEKDLPRRLTSWHSYRRRQEELRWMVEKAIPENSREIDHARSYGDLRENFEYKTAKERQRLLMTRVSDLDTDLKTVQATDFAGFSAEKAGPGTTVVIRRGDETTDTYHILGEWDVDETLGVISSQSRVAQLLTGHGVGEMVTLPSRSGASEESCHIQAVTPPPETIREWIMASPEPITTKLEGI
jgi:transcription elongation GreA/GreB family factor